MRLFGWQIHRGECRCPNPCLCADHDKSIGNLHARADRYELLFRREAMNASRQNKLSRIIHAQRAQIRRLKALLPEPENVQGRRRGGDQ